MPEKKTNSRESLLRKPTTFEWAVELQRVLNGEREVSLLKLQSVGAHINKILVRSDDEALARVCFQDALKQIVQAWQPNERFSKEYLACMLDLIGACGSLEGAAKVLGFLGKWGTFSEAIESSGGYGAESDLNLKALVVLESHFSVAPHEEQADQTLIFQSYVGVLLEYLTMARYGGYVATRLIELGIIQFADQRLGELVRLESGAIYELLSLVFTPTRRSRLRADLGALASHIANSTGEARSLFESVLQVYGARMIHTPSGSEVILDDENRIEVPSETADSIHGLEISAESAAPQMIHRARLNAQVSQLPKLLGQGDEEARTIVWRIFEQCLMLGTNSIEHFAAKLKQTGGRLEHNEREVQIVLAGGSRFGDALTEEASLRYLVWYSSSTKAPTRSRAIRQLGAASGTV